MSTVVIGLVVMLLGLGTGAAVVKLNLDGGWLASMLKLKAPPSKLGDVVLPASPPQGATPPTSPPQGATPPASPPQGTAPAPSATEDTAATGQATPQGTAAGGEAGATAQPAAPETPEAAQPAAPETPEAAQLAAPETPEAAQPAAPETPAVAAKAEEDGAVAMNSVAEEGGSRRTRGSTAAKRKRGTGGGDEDKAWEAAARARGAANFAASPDKVGLLTLVTEPYAKVYFNERYLGDTPLFKVSLPAGKHTLRLVGPEGHSQQVPVEIKAGETTPLRLTLGAAGSR